MKQLRTALGASIFCLAGLTGSLPVHASILDIRIDNPMITAVLPASGTTTEYFFTGSIANTSAYDLNFDQQFDNAFVQIGGIGVPLLYTGPGPAEGVLSYTDPNSGLPSSGGLLQQPMFGSCLWGAGISSSCLRAGTTYNGTIAAAIVGFDTAPGIYRLTQDGAGHPATITFQGTYLLDGRVKSFTQDSPYLSVNVVSEQAVPELKTWALVVAGLAGVVLIGSKRTGIGELIEF
jgi:hypothetical protein